MKAAEVVDHWTGLRPGRVRLRLELEHFDQARLQEAAEAAEDLRQQQQQEGEEGEQQGVWGGASDARPGGRVSDGLKVVHCYGHGGSGLTLAWGTAGDAVQLALKAVQHADA